MIKIESVTLKKQPNFWNKCLFHPTDAIEDPWGKRILDKIAADGAINTVRIYTMFEDIVYFDENDKLCYDFRISDLRLDYMLEKGYDLLLAYGGMPDCIAASVANKTSMSKNKTRYKGKMWNSAPPKDYALWEEICYEYTKHIVERYGIETVSKWRCDCFNEPDLKYFFFSELSTDDENVLQYRLPAYCKMYEAFERGVRRVSDDIIIGGPSLAYHMEFFGGFLDYVKEKNLKLDFISVHIYGTNPESLNDGSRPVNAYDIIEKLQQRMEVVREHGFANIPIYIDEWGFSTAGFFNKEECPALMGRETEMFSAYFVKLIYNFIHSGIKIDMLCICLSGQHEMVEDFSGFRNFFTLNFIAKPIYNAHILAAKLYENLLDAETENENVFVIPTKNEKSDYSILLTYCGKNFEENLAEIEEKLTFADDVQGKTVTIYCIDKETTNPYRLYQKKGVTELSHEDIKELRQEGRMKPVAEFDAKEKISLKLTANCVYLVEVK